MGGARLTPEQKQEMCRLYQTGLSTTEVAKQFGCTGQTVSAALKSNGIKTRLDGRMKAGDSDEFDRRLADRNPSIIRVGPYMGARNKTLFRCLKHNKEYEVISDNIMRGYRLRCCGVEERKAKARAKEEAAIAAKLARAKKAEELAQEKAKKAEERALAKAANELPKELIEELVDAFISGETVSSLMEKYSLSRGQVNRLVKQSGRKREIQPISRAQGLDKISIKEAKEKGLPFFFEERVCKRGHIDLWITGQNQCIVCKRLNNHEYSWRKDPVNHLLRPGFGLKCEQCGSEVVLKGQRTGYERSWSCSISETYKEDTRFCSKKCNDKWFSSRPERLERIRHRYHNDPEYRAKVMALAEKRRSDPKQKEWQAAYYKNYQEENKDKLAKYKRKWMSEKYETDVEFKIKMQLRHRVKEAIRHGYKSASTLELLGESVEHAKKHLESLWEEGMSWENWTSDGWHIDHIRPCATFDLTIPDQQQLCFSWRNLQPLWGSENVVKRHAYEPHDEVEWAGRMRELGYDGELFLLYGGDE